MIADVFYPIFTLTITILAFFYKEKKHNFSGICIHMFTKASPWIPWGNIKLNGNSNGNIHFWIWKYSKFASPLVDSGL